MKRTQLSRRCLQKIHRGHAKGTRQNHRTHYTAYLRFCDEFKYSPFPADSWRYCQFAQFLDEEKKLGTVENYVSTIRTLHKINLLAVPEDGQIHYKLLTECLKKERSEPVKQAEPMSH